MSEEPEGWDRSRRQGHTGELQLNSVYEPDSSLRLPPGSQCWGPSGVLLGDCGARPGEHDLPASVSWCYQAFPPSQSWRLGPTVLGQGVSHVRVVKKERGRIPHLTSELRSHSSQEGGTRLGESSQGGKGSA